jgi:hypothetical protein
MQKFKKLLHLDLKSFIIIIVKISTLQKEWCPIKRRTSQMKKTKHEMIAEMSNKLNWKPNSIKNREKNTYAKVKQAYDFYQKSEKGINDQLFVMSVIAVR